MFKNLSGISTREREFKILLIPLRGCFNEAMLWGRQKKASKVRFDEDIPLSCFWLESGSQNCNFLVRGNRSDITEAPESHKYERVPGIQKPLPGGARAAKKQGPQRQVPHY